jgi:hypothetical protein
MRFRYSLQGWVAAPRLKLQAAGIARACTGPANVAGAREFMHPCASDFTYVLLCEPSAT